MRNFLLLLFALSVGYGLGFQDAQDYDDNIVVRMVNMVVSSVINRSVGHRHWRTPTAASAPFPCVEQHHPFEVVPDTIPDFF